MAEERSEAQWAYHTTDHFRTERSKFVQSGGGREELVKLHLGCGKRKFRGYLNVDTVGTPDLVCDITALPHEPETISEILAVHVFEHIFPWKAEEALSHWYSLLVPDGKLILEMPDLRKVLEFFKNDKAPLSHTLFALYGGEATGRIEDIHKWAWSYSSLEPLLTKVGFKCEEKPAQYHVQERDFRIEGVK